MQGQSTPPELWLEGEVSESKYRLLVRDNGPGIVLYLNENYGITLSELIMNGRMDMAVLYGGREVHGLSFVSLLREPLYLVSADPSLKDREQIALAELAAMDMLMPRPYNVIRRLVDEAFVRIGASARVVAEIESPSTLSAAVAEHFGCTILPESSARVMVGASDLHMCRIVEPEVEAPLALCLSGHLPLSVPAQAVKAIILELVAQMRGSLI